MKRTLLTTGLVVALLLSMTFPASAVETTLPDSAAQPVEGITETPENEGAETNVLVTVPSKAEFVLNPYCMSIETAEGVTQDAVICRAQSFYSRTPAPVAVSVAAVGEKYGDVRLAASPDDVKQGDKAAFLWFEFQTVEDGQEPSWIGEYIGATNQILLNTSARPVLELPASVDGEAVEAVFRVFGALGIPSEGMWTADDVVDVSLSFEFETLEDEAALYGVTSETVPADEASDVEEAVDIADEASDVEEPADVVDEVSDVEEPVDVADEASDVEEVVDVADEASDVVQPTIGEPPIPMDVDEASDVEEPVDVTDDVSDVEEPADVADDASDVEEPVDVADDASDVEEPVDVADGASDVEEAVDVADDASDVEEAVDVADDASDVEEVVDVADEASDVEEPADVVDEVSDVEEAVDVTDEASDVEEAVDVADEAFDVDEDVDAEEDAKKPDEGEEPADIDAEEDIDDVDVDVEENVDDVDVDVEEDIDDVDVDDANPA